MKVNPIAICFAYSTLALTGALPSQALGDHDAQGATSQYHHNGSEQKKRVGEFVKVVREATGQFKDVTLAEAAGYHLAFGCVSGPDVGAMGLHYVNMSLVGDGVLDPTLPEIVIYEQQPNGRLKLIGADYLVFYDDWHATNEAAPELMGQLMHLFESPNRFGLPAFYTLHVWAWRDNPLGTFVNWHSRVSCDSFDGQAH
jgi:hypothetical protein